MDYGLILPNFRDDASGEAMDAGAGTAERLGWSTVWTTDHVIVEPASAEEYGRNYDAILTLAWLGARHARVRLAASVIVVPYRNAVVVAKQLASLDELSGGRVLAGVGVGWDEAEFANLGVGDRYRVRGAYTDEAIRLWRHLWSGAGTPFEGRFHPLTDYVFAPLPAQGAGLPIVVGGGSDAACRRAGTLGDAWHSSAMGPPSFARRVPKIRAAAEAAGRPMPQLTARVRVRLGAAADPWYSMHGSPEEVATEVRAFAELGATHLAIDFATGDAAALVGAMEAFAAEVQPLV
jgi:probable F420-dependent oxidoreductase